MRGSGEFPLELFLTLTAANREARNILCKITTILLFKLKLLEILSSSLIG